MTDTKDVEISPAVQKIIKYFKTFEYRKAQDALQELFMKMQKKKGFLYFHKIVNVCKEINKDAWNTFFYCAPMHFGSDLTETPELDKPVIVDNFIAILEEPIKWGEEDKAKATQICGNVKAQYKVKFYCEILDPLIPSETITRIKNCLYDPSRNGRPVVHTTSEAINPEVKAVVKTINDYRRIVGSLYGSNKDYNHLLLQEFHYFRDGEEITDNEPGGASRIDDYTIERVPCSYKIIVNFTLPSKKKAKTKKQEN